MNKSNLTAAERKQIKNCGKRMDALVNEIEKVYTVARAVVGIGASFDGWLADLEHGLSPAFTEDLAAWLEQERDEERRGAAINEMRRQMQKAGVTLEMLKD